MSRAVVVGAGISGLTAAALLARRGEEVTVVDGAAVPGGLLSSVAGPDGLWFDHGTHVPQETGCPPLDRLLFAAMGTPPWQELEPMRAGTVFRGRLAETPFPDLTTLPVDRRAAVEADLRAAAAGPEGRAVDEEGDEATALVARFGAAGAAELRPTVEAFFGTDAARLAAGSHRFVFARVLAFDADEARQLKEQDPAFDDRIGFHDPDEGASGRRAWYPTDGGAGRWVEDVQRHLLEPAGVTLALGRTIEHVELADGAVVEIRLDDGARLAPDHVAWTVPVVGFLRAAGQALPPGVGPPAFRTSILHHLVLDRPVATDLHYVAVLDAEREVFRATCYERLRGCGPSAVTVEVVSGGPPADEQAGRAQAVAELVEMGVLAPGTTVTWARTDVVEAGFPVPTVAARQANVALTAAAEGAAGNVTFLGRSTGRAFFMADVLRGCWEAFGA